VELAFAPQGVNERRRNGRIVRDEQNAVKIEKNERFGWKSILWVLPGPGLMRVIAGFI
jgi:hypothetical protein